MAPKIVCMGNPLLDMQVTKAPELLEKYGLLSNNAVLVSKEQMPIYEELRTKYDVTYVAGGAAQNAARAAQYALPAGSVAYIGSIGKDKLGETLRAANEKEGVASFYHVDETHPTGACAVVITGHDRSLVTLLAAAEKFKPSHLDTQPVKELVDGADLFYLGGFFLTHGVESAVKLAERVTQAGKTFAMNLSAPFIPQFFKAQVEAILPYADYVIANEAEFASYASANGLNPDDLESVIAHVAKTPKKTGAPRTVVLTQGANQTLVYANGTVSTFPVSKLADDQIVDTNGAGDAFAGGFLAALASKLPIPAAVEAGHRLGQNCVGQVGAQFNQSPKQDVLKGL